MGSNARKVRRKQKKAGASGRRASVHSLPETPQGVEPEASVVYEGFEPPPPRRGVTLSLCMIVRDEAKRLAACLQSVEGLVDEIIVIDTGSEDATPEIARRFGAQVTTLPWRNDFAWARNESLKRATGEWILVLDGDECLNRQDHARIRELIAQGTQYCWMLTQRHYSNEPRHMGFVPNQGEFPAFERESHGYFESSLVRLFPNRKGIWYQFRIHELVEPRIEQIPGLVIRNSGVRIHHYGHLEANRWQVMKKGLYQRLGEDKVRDEPASWKSHFELAVEHSCSQRHADAVASFVSSLALNPQYTDSWINVGFVLGEMGVLPLAIAALEEAIRISPQAAEGHQNLGVMNMRRRNYREAVKCFERAIQLAPNHVIARCNLAETLIMLNEIQRARSIYENILSAVPDYRKALEGVVTCCALAGDTAEMQEAIAKLVAQPSENDARYFLVLAGVLRSRRALDEAKQVIEVAVARLHEGDPLKAVLEQQIALEVAKIENARLLLDFARVNSETGDSR